MHQRVSIHDLQSQNEQGEIAFETANGSVIVPLKMLTGVAGINGNTAQISIAKGDKSELDPLVQKLIGNRPFVQLTLSIDGKQTNWSNPKAPVTVAIPYTPTSVELAHPANIVVWYIDGSGNAGKLSPTATTTREEMAQVLYNLLGNEWNEFGQSLSFLQKGRLCLFFY